MHDLLRWTKIKIKDVQQKIINIVTNCKTCQLTNAAANPKNPVSQLRGKKPGIYWEVDFTEVTPGEHGYRYLLTFVDTFSG